MSGPIFNPEHLGRNTALLLAPQAVAWQVSFVLYGIYLALFVTNVRGPMWKKFAREVKITNWVVCVLVTVYNILAFVDNIFWTITLNREPDYIYVGWPVDFLLPLSASSVGLICQVFLTIRASVLINRRQIRHTFIVGMFLLALTSFAGANLVVISGFLIWNNEISGYSIGYNHSIAIWLCTSAVVDIGISSSLYVTLGQRTGILREVDGLLHRLIFVALQTASYTAVPALAGAILSLVYPDSSVYSLVHFAFWMSLPSCYAISLYTTISTREMIDSYIAANNPLQTEDQQVHPGNALSQRLGSQEQRRSQERQSTSVRKHPLAEIAPWAFNLHQRGGRGRAGGGGPSAVDEAIVDMTMPEVARSGESEPYNDRDRTSSEKGHSGDETVVRGFSPLQGLGIEERRAVAEQVRGREREREEAQLREDNQRAVWW